MTFLLYLIVFLFVTACVLLTLLVLIQKGRGGGLSGAFGGGAGGHTAFGSKTGDVLTWATSIVFGVFLLLAIAANLVFNATSKASGKGTTNVVPEAESSKPVAPGSPKSSLPKAPLTADPGVKNTPPGPPQPAVEAPTSAPAMMAPSTQPTK